ncbi:DDE-type integrase/transposase/recombinase [Paracoccus sp. PAR01]|uniref:Mu transposase C-terminal domain-containing protein n=1 Tax=Paracoccus sp. PAR01 TaxID=2769282 RepID=UPI00178448CC|nr:DDE-type integrase/transposase/recombinase [Paracoccus sp. PAR01]MBD9529697.1 DDE-type integrase/transposase/recombinase [Paracoccus sp. PAR01]
MNIHFDTTRHHYAFGIHDRILIDNQAWRPVSSNEVGWVMSRPDEAGICQQFTHVELSQLGASRRIQTERNFFTAKSARRRLDETNTQISLLTDRQREALFARQIWVKAYHELELEKKIKRTDDSIGANLGGLTLRALKHADFLKGQNLSHASAGFQFRKAPSPRSLRKWLKDYEDDGLAGLVDRAHQRGNRTSVMCLTAVALMMGEVRGYLHPERPTMVTIFARMQEAFVKANAERELAGLPALRVPSRETVRRAINGLDPFQVEFHRKGAAAARKKFAPVGKGMMLTRPLQRVEIDEWDVDILSLLANADLLKWFSEDERKKLGLTGKTVRWKLTVAICATTRCILAMVMTPTAKATAAVQAIKMILSDKGALSTVVKAHGAWHMHGLPEEIVTDCGSAFRSEAFQTVCADLGISALRTIAGFPELRGRIERLFKTISINLLPELASRTFSGIAEKGDSDPAKRACLTENDLAFVLVRWVVDIYHNTEHEGLGGETPAKCWERLTAQFGVTPPPDTRTTRRIFGEKLKRKMDKSGIRVLGAQYHSPALAEHMLRRRDRDIEVRWLPNDLGEIEVRIDRDWMTVPAVMEELHGVSAELWMAAVREVRATDPERKRHDKKVMLAAMCDIRARSQDAQAAMGLLVDDWSDDRMRREEQKLMIGFEVGPVKAASPKPEDGGIGRSILTDHGDIGTDRARVSAARSKPMANSNFGLED